MKTWRELSSMPGIMLGTGEPQPETRSLLPGAGHLPGDSAARRDKRALRELDQILGLIKTSWEGMRRAAVCD